MNELNENGWSSVHNAAFAGYTLSVKRFIENDPEALELPTQDDLKQTPFLLAVSAGNEDVINCLIHLGAKIDVINTQNYGAIEICAVKKYVQLLEYFLSLDNSKLPVWKNLLKMVTSDMEDECEKAGECLFELTTQKEESDASSNNWKKLFDAGGVPAIVKTSKSTCKDFAKAPAIKTLLNMIEFSDVQDQLVSSGGIPAFVNLLKSEDFHVLQLSAEVIKELGRNRIFAQQISQTQAVPLLVKILQTIPDPTVTTPVVEAISNMADTSTSLRSTIGGTQGLIPAFVTSFDGQKNLKLLLALTKSVGSLTREENSNQTNFIREGIASHIINVVMTQARNREIQTSAIEAIQYLAEKNHTSQREFLDKATDRILLQILKKNRSEALQEKTAKALWALAGENIDEQRELAQGIGVHMLIEFLNSIAESMHFIGSEGLGVLAQGPLNEQSSIGTANGIQSLVRRLKSEDEQIVLSVIKTLRYLCVSVGNVPHSRNQSSISLARGIKQLLAILVHCGNEELQVEAAFTLAAACLANKPIQDEIFLTADFSYVRVLKMLYSTQYDVRIKAGSALAMFAYNNLNQQKEIAEQGGVRFNCFIPFLQSDDESFRCNAAYQIVILARIIPDEEQAKSSAAGIKLLVDLLMSSESQEIQAMAVNYIACLAHTRAGVPAAIVAINAVDYLCDLLSSKTEQVRGTAAIALSYLSHDHKGQRLILNRCRTDPYLMRVIKYYTKRSKLATNFIESWQHYRKIGLPPITDGRTCLVGESRDNIRPLSLLSLEDAPSNNRESTSNLIENFESMSRSTQEPQRRESFRNSRLSIDSSRSNLSRQSLIQTVKEG